MSILTAITVLWIIVSLLAVIIVPIMTKRELERLRKCSDEELPDAIRLYLRVRKIACLVELSCHFRRPMGKIRRLLQSMEGVKVHPESPKPIRSAGKKEDMGFESWIT